MYNAATRRWPWATSAQVIVVLIVIVLGSPAAGAWNDARAEFDWSFPRDHLAHPGFRTEWWYLTGLLRAADGTRFGYQFTLFRIGLTRRPAGEGSDWRAGELLMGHAALTEIDGGRHRFSEVVRRASPLLAGLGRSVEQPLAWIRAPAGTDDRWSVTLDGGGFAVRMRDERQGLALTLRARAGRPMVRHGVDGYSRKPGDGRSASQYYSFTRLATTGELELDDRRLEVRGTSWMDQEFSTGTLADDQVGWGWFGLRLEDGRDLMLYRLRRADGSTSYAGGTLVAADGSVRALAPGAWQADVRERWTTPDGLVRYPTGWTIRLPAAGIELRIRAEFEASENASATGAGLRYWEGPVRIESPGGQRIGEGYAELTGYGEGTRPPV